MERGNITRSIPELDLQIKVRICDIQKRLWTCSSDKKVFFELLNRCIICYIKFIKQLKTPYFFFMNTLSTVNIRDCIHNKVDSIDPLHQY